MESGWNMLVTGPLKSSPEELLRWIKVTVLELEGV